MEEFMPTDPDPEVVWDDKVYRLSHLLPMFHAEFVRRRVPPFEADELVSILLERLWSDRRARGHGRPPGRLYLESAELRRLSNALIQARRRTARGVGVIDALFRGPQNLSNLGKEGGVDPNWIVDPRPGPDLLAERKDTDAEIRRRARRVPGEFPGTKQRLDEILANAPHPPPRYGREVTRRARRLLRRIYGALFGVPSEWIMRKDRDRRFRN
jgi:hypothetical protein